MSSSPKHLRKRVRQLPPLPKRDSTVNFVSIAQALVVADYASFSRAARVLGVRQSAVSRRIQALENELGVSLFERQRDGVRITLAGHRFFEQTRAAFVEIDLAVAKAASAGVGADGVVRIGISAEPLSDFFVTLVEDFQQDHPCVRLDFRQDSTRRNIASVFNRSLDVAVVAQAPEPADYDSAPLWSSRICVAMPQTHVLSIGKEIDWAYLREQRFIFGPAERCEALCKLVRDKLDDVDRRAEIACYTVDHESLMQFVALGFGLTLISEPRTDRCYPGVILRPLAGSNSRMSYSAVWLPENDNPALRRFLSLARSRAAELQSASIPTKKS